MANPNELWNVPLSDKAREELEEVLRTSSSSSRAVVLPEATAVRTVAAFLPGDEVALSGGPGAATVVAVHIHQDRVTYDVAWWSGVSRSTATVESFEVVAAKPPRLIGFSRGAAPRD